MKKLNNIASYITIRKLINLLLIFGALLIAFIATEYGAVYAAAFSLLPVGLLLIINSFRSPQLTFTIAFIINYFLIGISRYVPYFPGGIALDILLIITFASILIRSCYTHIEWRDAINGLSLVALIWFVYCSFELFNPMEISLAWMKSIRGIAVYFLVIALFAPLLFKKYLYVKRILIILSVLTLCAVAKALIQKYFGFDAWEERWLYEDGGSSTHIIYSGIRYFSFYSDAGNFGAAMGFAMVVFSILSIYTTKKLRYYFLFVAAAAAIGMIISGTRGALAVPLVGYVSYILLCKNVKITLIGLFMLITAFVFLKSSDIGNGNQYIRRMRTALDVNDASFQVRLNNQKKLAVYMEDLPFGTGIGMGGGKAKEFAPDRYLSQIPTDSWFVLIWVETGIVGLVIYLSIQLYIFLYGCYLVLFKLRNKRLRGFVCAMLCGIGGMLVASYGNEIWGQLPNIFVLTLCQAFIFLSPIYDKELENSTSNATK